MKVTSKGQVTIPLEVRRRLGIEPGTEVSFEIVDGAARLVRHAGTDGAAAVKAMRGQEIPMTTDEIMALTRGDS